MNKKNPKVDSSAGDSSHSPDSRRQFLQSAGAVAGALVLSRIPANAAEAVGPATDAIPASATTNLNLAQHPQLAKVGGFEIVEIGGERVIVAHTASGFAACSAKCPHRGCDVEYHLNEKQFVCPCHNSRFEESGKLVKGPAKVGLKPFDAAQVIAVKPR